MKQRVYFQTIPLEEILIQDSVYTHTSHLRKRLLRDGVLENKCAFCGVNEWRGRPLTLHLDHINGNNKDNRLANLRLLCPNCHSQTETYCGRKNRVQNFCMDCQKPINRQALRCKSCTMRRRGTKINWPPSKELREMVAQSSFLATARKLKVSDNAVRKRLARHPED